MRKKESFWSRLKILFRIQEELKRKKKQELEEERKKKEVFYHRWKILFLSIIFFFVGIFKPKKINQNKKTKKIHFKKINQKVFKKESQKNQTMKISKTFIPILKTKKDIIIKKKNNHLKSRKKKCIHLYGKNEKKNIFLKQLKLVKKKKPVIIKQVIPKTRPIQKFSTLKKVNNSIKVIGAFSLSSIGALTKGVVNTFQMQQKRKKENFTKETMKPSLSTFNLKQQPKKVLTGQSDIKKNSKTEIKPSNNMVMSHDFDISFHIIQENIRKQNKELETIQTDLLKLSKDQKQKKIISKVKLISSAMIGFMIGFLPMKLFKNKFFGFLTASILMNIQIQKMKKLMKGDFQKISLQTYQTILYEVEKKQDTLWKIKEINTNSIQELEKLERKILTFNQNNQNNMLLVQIRTIQKNLLFRNQQIKQNIEQIKEIETKQKQKTLETNSSFL